MAKRIYTAIGLMSGTSLDGVDAALIRTDGEAMVEPGPWLSTPYPPVLRAALRGLLGAEQADDMTRSVEAAITAHHVETVNLLLKENGITNSKIDVIGFHGHTITHQPERRFTWQLGDAAALAAALGRDVVADFRRADVAAGGQGAPFAPLYHRALAADLERPLAVLNIGGVANVTWIADEATIAFDTGPGNALIDDWVARHDRGAFDAGGAFAAAGLAEPFILAKLFDVPYFKRSPPKSLDRQDFGLESLGDLNFEDGAATLTGLTVAGVMAARDQFPAPAARWLVTGGGRHNAYMMRLLAAGLDAPVTPVEQVGWQGDALEAQAFGYLAVRTLRGLPLSLPTTTGVPEAMTGGRVARPA
ncbi:MAG: anhydro-N-acetylmuramic acid kinase [Alphaproteobacteria bacterium]|nr:anhydro-N-acetylmuramic acid kinase [Alphaproteobacteria bacterium]